MAYRGRFCAAHVLAVPAFKLGAAILLTGLITVAMADRAQATCPTELGVSVTSPSQFFAAGIVKAGAFPDLVQTSDDTIFLSVLPDNLPSSAFWSVNPSLVGVRHSVAASSADRVNVASPYSHVTITLSGAGVDGCSYAVDFIALDMVKPTPAPTPAPSATPTPNPGSSSPPTPTPASSPTATPTLVRTVAVLACKAWGPEPVSSDPSMRIGLSPQAAVVDPYLSYQPPAPCGSQLRTSMAKKLHVGGLIALGSVVSNSAGVVDLTPCPAPDCSSASFAHPIRRGDLFQATMGHNGVTFVLPPPPNTGFLAPVFRVNGLQCLPRGALQPAAICTASAKLLLPPVMTLAGGSKEIDFVNSGTVTTFKALGMSVSSPVELRWKPPTKTSLPMTRLKSVLVDLTNTTNPISVDASVQVGQTPITTVTSVGVVEYPLTGGAASQSLYRPIAAFVFPAAATTPAPNGTPAPTPTPLPATGMHVFPSSGSFDPTDEQNVNLNVTASIDVGVSIPAPPTSSTSPKSASLPVASLRLAGIGVTTTAETIYTPDKWPALNFRNANLVLDDGSQLFWGHRVTNCGNGALPVSFPKQTSATVCFAMNLGPGSASLTGDDTDRLFALLTLEDCGTGTRIGDCANLPTNVRFRLKALTAAPSSPMKIRFGAGTLSADDLQLDFSGNVRSTLDNVIGPQRLAQLKCIYTPIVGTATVTAAAVNGGGATATTILGGTATQTSSSGAATFESSPEIAIGPDCIALRLAGVLPLQLSTQSSLVLSRLIYVHSIAAESAKDPKIDRMFMEMGGAFTSGNVTIVLNSLSFRTLGPGDICPLPPPTLANPDPSGLVEHRFISGTCVSYDINWNASAGITGVQNASGIERTITNVLSGIVGYLVHAVRL